MGNPRHFHVPIGLLVPCVVLRTHSKIHGAELFPAQHLGTATKHGDYFTYKVWNLPSAKWENERELVRNILTMQQHTDTYPRINYTDEELTMSKNPCADKPKRKR